MADTVSTPAAMTVAAVLDMPQLAGCAPTVLAAREHLGRSVRWVHAAEVADVAHLLRGGELVLTTGIALPSAGPALRAYVTELADAGAAGLVVELGRRWHELPNALVDTCQQRDLPLVALRREASFAAVIQAVAERVVDAQLVELRAAERIHETFTRFSDSGADTAAILAEVARTGGHPVILESTRHHVLGFDPAGEDLRPLLDRWEERSRAVTLTERTGYDDALGWLVTVVGAQGDDWGRLVLLLPQPPVHRHVVLAERAASTLALQRLLAREREGLERQTHRTLLLALSEPVPAGSDLPARCAAAGVPLVGRSLVGLVTTPAVAAAEGVMATSGEPQRVRDLAEALAAAAREAALPVLVGVLDDSAVECLVALPAQLDPDRVVDGLAQRLHRRAPGLTGIVAAGSVVDQVSAVPRTLVEARQVAEAARRSPRGQACHRLPDVHLRGLLHLLADDDRVSAFADRELASLRTYDDTHGTSLVEALWLLVRHPGNKAAAAAALHVSRGAYYERLSRIERILGVDLSDAETLTSLHVALLISRRG